MGCPVARKCAVACLLGEESQQPTCPHERHSRRCTQCEPIFKQSSQPAAGRVTVRILIADACAHGVETLTETVMTGT